MAQHLRIRMLEAVNQKDNSSQIFPIDNLENFEHPRTAALDAVQARHKGIPVSSWGPWGKGMQLSCLRTPVDCRAGSCVKAQVRGFRTSEQSDGRESDQSISQIVSRLQ